MSEEQLRGDVRKCHVLIKKQKKEKSGIREGSLFTKERKTLELLRNAQLRVYLNFTQFNN